VLRPAPDVVDLHGEPRALGDGTASGDELEDGRPRRLGDFLGVPREAEPPRRRGWDLSRARSPAGRELP